MKKIYVAYPSAGTVCLEFCQSLAKMVGYMARQEEFDMQFALDFAMGSNWIANRELIAQNALRMDATHLVFLDDDMYFEPDILMGMLAREKPIVATNYLVKEWPPTTWCAMNMRHERMPTTAESTGLEEALGCGFGVSIIETKVFKDIPQPWFLPVWNEDKREYSTEDFPFFGRARDAGYTVWIDHDASKKVAHVGKHRWRWQDWVGGKP